MTRNEVFCAAACAAALLLGGCGGGDGGGDSGTGLAAANPPATQTPAPPVEKSAGTPFVGVWESDTGCSSNWDLVPAADSGKGSFRIQAVTFTETTMSRQHSLYSDGACEKLVGTVTYNYDLIWSSSSIAGWSDVARVDARFNRYDVSNSSIELDPLEKEAPGHLTKSILAIKYDPAGAWLYWADTKSAKDADGYPAAFRNYSTDFRVKK